MCLCVCACKSVCQVGSPFFCPVYLQCDKLAINFASLQHPAAHFAGQQRFASFHFRVKPLMCKGFYSSRQKDSAAVHAVFTEQRPVESPAKKGLCIDFNLTFPCCNCRCCFPLSLLVLPLPFLLLLPSLSLPFFAPAFFAFIYCTCFY